MNTKLIKTKITCHARIIGRKLLSIWYSRWLLLNMIFLPGNFITSINYLLAKTINWHRHRLIVIKSNFSSFIIMHQARGLFFTSCHQHYILLSVIMVLFKFKMFYLSVSILPEEGVTNCFVNAFFNAEY